MTLAVDTAQLSLWRWNIREDVVLIDAQGRTFHGIPEHEPITFQRLLGTLHQEDRGSTRQAVLSSLSGDGEFHGSYRVVLAGGAVRWIETRGRVE